MKPFVIIFTFCWVSLFGSGHLTQSPWRPIRPSVHHRRFAKVTDGPTEQVVIITAKSDVEQPPKAAPPSHSILKVVRSRIRYDGLVNKVKFDHGESTSYSSRGGGGAYGQGMDILLNRNGGQGRSAMSVNSYVGSATPENDYNNQNLLINPRNDRDHSVSAGNPVTTHVQHKLKSYEQLKYEQETRNDGRDGSKLYQTEFNMNQPNIVHKNFQNNYIPVTSGKQVKTSIRPDNPNTVPVAFNQHQNFLAKSNHFAPDRHQILNSYDQNKNSVFNDFGMNNKFHQKPNFHNHVDYPNKEPVSARHFVHPEPNQFPKKFSFDQNTNPHNSNENKYSMVNQFHQNDRPPLAYNFDQNRNPIQHVNQFPIMSAAVPSANIHANQPLPPINYDQNRNNHENNEHNRQFPISYNTPPEQRRPLSYNNNNHPITKPLLEDHHNFQRLPEFNSNHIDQPSQYRLNSFVDKTLFYGDFDFKLHTNSFG